MDTLRMLKPKGKEVLIGEPVLSRYERARIVGARALQISQGAPLLIDVEELLDELRPIDIAQMELRARVLPVGLARKRPDKKYQIIPIQWLKDREFIGQA